MLYIDDLVRAYTDWPSRRSIRSAARSTTSAAGRSNTISVWAEAGPLLERLIGKPIDVRYGDWRPGDQPVYISDISKVERDLNWEAVDDVRSRNRAASALGRGESGGVLGSPRKFPMRLSVLRRSCVDGIMPQQLE